MRLQPEDANILVAGASTSKQALTSTTAILSSA